MNKINKGIITETEKYIVHFFNENDDNEKMFFHNIKHTKYVADGVMEIGKAEGLDEGTLMLVLFCAWFHDTGYFIDYKNHEEESVKLAIGFLKDKNIDAQQLAKIESYILSTRWPQNPSDLPSKILCDADMKHLSDPDYFEFSELLRKEFIQTKGSKVKKSRFYLLNGIFLAHHQYYTKYGKTILHQGKEKNINRLNKRIEKSKQKENSKIIENVSDENEKLKKKLEKSKGYSRGVESMFRLTARNQISLSSIADNKSNILITVNSIIISISLTVLVSKFENTPSLIIPTLIFLAFSLITIVFAILSTRPNISSRKFTKEDILQNKMNLLFFGNFYTMKFDEYEWAIQQLMRNDENLYSIMIKDQYYLGKVLAKKYKLLRISYNVFMIGMIISVLAFIFAHIGL